MYDPELFSHYGVAHEDAEELISKYIKYVKLDRTNFNLTLDVGCGSGDITWEVLRPLLPSNTQIYALDVAPSMIAHAATRYPGIRFLVHDIASETIPNNMYGVFAQVFSFHCLHWIHVQRQAMTNIFNCLKYGGSLLTYYIITNPIFDAFYNVAQLEQWKNYIPDAKMPIFHRKPNVEETIKNILIDTGFDVSVCKLMQRECVHTEEVDLRYGLASVHPHIHKIPDHLKETFIDDSVKELFKLKDFQGQTFKNGKVKYPYSIILIVASKPSRN